MWIVKTRFRTMIGTIVWLFSPIGTMLLFAHLAGWPSWFKLPLLLLILLSIGAFPVVVRMADKNDQDDGRLRGRLRDWMNSYGQ